MPPSATGTMIEIPARAPGLAANLWLHIGMNATNWEGFPSQGVSQRSWSRSTLYATIGVEPGDIPVASTCCVGLSGMHREEQGIFDSDTWGLALDSMTPMAPGALEFAGDLATAGKAWPGGIWLLADVMVLRPSLIPPVPVPYGTYPSKSHRWNWPFEKYVELIKKFRYLTNEEMKLLRRLNTELQDVLTSGELEKVAAVSNPESFHQQPTIKRANVSFKISSIFSSDSESTMIARSKDAEKPKEQISAESKKEPRSRPGPRTRK